VPIDVAENQRFWESVEIERMRKPIEALKYKMNGKLVAPKCDQEGRGGEEGGR
jgi:hypothetical protein